MAAVRNIFVEIPPLKTSFHGKLLKRFEERTTPEEVLVHDKCHQPVQQRVGKKSKPYDITPEKPREKVRTIPPEKVRFLCRHCRKRISRESVVGAYLSEMGEIFVADAEDQSLIERARPKKNILRIDSFIIPSTVGFVIQVDSYTLVPELKSALAYAKFQKKLKESGQYGWGQVWISKKAYPVLIRAYDNLLFLDLLACDDEIGLLPKIPSVTTDRQEIVAGSLDIRIGAEEFKPKKHLAHPQRTAIGRARERTKEVTILNESVWPEDTKQITEPVRSAVKTLRVKNGKKKSSQGRKGCR